MQKEAKHTRFGEEKQHGTIAERGRVLTMKYGKHQMKLIKKRMNVENIIEAKLTALFGGDHNVTVELDEILDIESTAERRNRILDLTRKAECPASKSAIDVFLDEIIELLATL